MLNSPIFRHLKTLYIGEKGYIHPAHTHCNPWTGIHPAPSHCWWWKGIHPLVHTACWLWKIKAPCTSICTAGIGGGERYTNCTPKLQVVERYATLPYDAEKSYVNVKMLEHRKKKLIQHRHFFR
jgi:hypothetical protein